MTSSENASGSETAPSDHPVTLIDIVADPVCPWCQVGLAIFDRVKRDDLADLNIVPRFRAYQLNPGTPEAGADRQRYYEAKFPDPAVRAAQREALVQAAAAAGFDFDPGLPKILPNTLSAHALIRQAHYAGLQDKVVAAVYDAFWRRGENIGEDAVLRAAAEAAGMEKAAIDAALSKEPGAPRDQAAQEAAAMRQAGVSGVPTFIVNERAAFSGALPAADLRRVICKALTVSPPIATHS